MFLNPLHWLDLIWIPVIFFGVHKVHRWWALGFITGSIIIVHLVTEVFVAIDYERGIMGVLQTDVHTRAFFVSSAFYVVFLIMAHFSRKTQGIVFMAASLSIFFMIFFTVSLTMLL